MFLDGHGFDYILRVFMTKEVSLSGSQSKSDELRSLFELKHIAFLLKLLRIFIMAAFSSSDKESSQYDSPSLNLTGDSRLLQL
jgi:hypothetical protein